MVVRLDVEWLVGSFAVKIASFGPGKLRSELVCRACAAGCFSAGGVWLVSLFAEVRFSGTVEIKAMLV